MNSDSEASPFERFCVVVSQIPAGKVCSYGRVAELASLGNARQTCRHLRALPRGTELPWHRVVSAQGKLAEFANTGEQRKRLEREGVHFTPKQIIPKHYYL